MRFQNHLPSVQINSRYVVFHRGDSYHRYSCLRDTRNASSPHLSCFSNENENGHIFELI